MNERHGALPTHTARTALRLRMLVTARPVGDIRSDAALFPNYFGHTCYYYFINVVVVAVVVVGLLLTYY